MNILQYDNMSWILDLVNENFIIENKYNKSFRLKLPIIFTVSKWYIGEIEKNYIHDQEIGGFFICDANTKDKKLEVKGLVFITNDSDQKFKEYLPKESERSRVVNYACEKHLIPLMFHTHCSHNDDGTFICELNTSPDDQDISIELKISVYDLCGYNIYLPDILIVCHKNYNLIFVGLYGGKTEIPLNFEKQKDENTEEIVRTLEGGLKFFKELDPRIQTITLIGVGYILLKYYKVSIPMLMGTINILPYKSLGSKMPKQFFLDIATGDIEILLEDKMKK